MNVRYKKALMELWLNPTRSGLMIFALILGLWGLGSNLVSYFILNKDLNSNFIGTKPPHLILTSNDFNKLSLSSLKNFVEIESAEFRDLSYQRIEVFPDQWIPMWLYGVEQFDKMELALIYQEEGKTTPAPGSMHIERNGQLVSNLKMNSIARVRVKGKTFTIPISGISFDPAQAPATQDAFIYAYVDKQTFKDISGEPGDRRLIIRLKQVQSKQDVQRIIEPILARFRASGIKFNSIDIPNFNQHPHQFQLNTLIMLQASIGLLAFVLGAILISQLMQAILAQQVRQIGILKALGASRSQVMGIYLAMVLGLGLIASFIAIPSAVASGYAFAGFVSKVLNFNILTTVLPLPIYIALVLTGLLLPLLFTLPTLLRGSGVSVKQALSDYGINQPSVVTRSRILIGLPVSDGFRLSIRNLARNKNRLFVTIFMIALGVALFSTGFNVRQSLVEFLDDTKKSIKYDVKIVLRNQISPLDATTPFRALSNLRHMEMWSGGHGRIQSGVVSASNGIGIVALPYNTELLKWDVIAGRWLESKKETEVVINQAAADTLNSPKTGELLSFSLNGTPISARLVGIVKEFNPPKIYIDKDQYDTLANPDHFINSLMLTATDRDYNKIIEMKKEIEKIIESTDLDVLYVMSQTERAEIIYNHLNIILTMLVSLSFLVLVVSAFGMASTTGINIMERTREIGVMRAIGATPKLIYSLFVSEGMIINGIGIVLGILAGLPLSVLASEFFGNLILGQDVSLGFAFSLDGFAITLGVVLVFAWLASRIPAGKAVSVSIREALSYV